MTEFNIKTPRGRALVNALAALEWAMDPPAHVPADRVLLVFQLTCEKASMTCEEAISATLEALAALQPVLLARIAGCPPLPPANAG